MTPQLPIGPHLKQFLAAQDRPLSATEISLQIGYPAAAVRQALTYLHFLGEGFEYHRPKKSGCAGSWLWVVRSAPVAPPPPPPVAPLPKHGGTGITADDLAWMAKYRAQAKDKTRIHALRGRV